MFDAITATLCFAFISLAILALAMYCQELIQDEYEDSPYDDELF
jgi:hypothetical protein